MRRGKPGGEGGGKEGGGRLGGREEVRREIHVYMADRETDMVSSGRAGIFPRGSDGRVN